MDTRADCLCVCAHRSSFSDARTRVDQPRSSTFKKTNVAVSSEKETSLRQTVPCGTDNVQDTVLHIAGSIVGGSISTISPNVDSNHPFSAISVCSLILYAKGIYQQSSVLKSSSCPNDLVAAMVAWRHRPPLQDTSKSREPGEQEAQISH